MDETIALIEQSHQGDKEAREQLVKSNLGLVWSIVRRFDNRGHEMEDLFQIGSIGLMKAIDKFDTTFGVRFSTYAVPMITGEIKRFLRDDGMIKVSRSLKESAARIKGVEAQLMKELGREVTLKEVSGATGIAMEEIVMALEANVEVESIYRSVYQADGKETCLADRLPEKEDRNEEQLDQMLAEDQSQVTTIDAYKEKARRAVKCCDDFPLLVYTADETAERASLLADIQTYIKTMKAQFIIGETDIDSNWDTFINTLNGMRLQRLLEIEQQAYDRYAKNL